MSQEEERATRIVTKAEELIREIEQKLSAGEALFRQQGIDHAALQEAMSATEKKESARLLADDLAAVESDVARELALLECGDVKRTVHRRFQRSMI